MDNLLKKFNNLPAKQQTYIAITVFAILIALFYGNTLGNGFIFEGRDSIENNPYLSSLQHFPKTFFSCSWEYVQGTCDSSTPYYRPMFYLSIFFTYQISSQPWFFHLINLFYFLAAASLLFIFAKMLTKNLITAFLASILFIVHPMNSEVNWKENAHTRYVQFGLHHLKQTHC